MNSKASASVKTVGKYLLWTAVAAVATAALNVLPNVNIPEIAIPLVAAALKGLATWAATEASQ